MATVNIKITASVAKLQEFADGLGYPTEVSKSQEEIASLPQPVAIQDTIKPNPQSKQDFLLEYFKNFVVAELAKQQVRNIEREIHEAKELEKGAVRTTLEGAVNVTIT